MSKEVHLGAVLGMGAPRVTDMTTHLLALITKHRAAILTNHRAYIKILRKAQNTTKVNILHPATWATTRAETAETTSKERQLVTHLKVNSTQHQVSRTLINHSLLDFIINNPCTAALVISILQAHTQGQVISFHTHIRTNHSINVRDQRLMEVQLSHPISISTRVPQNTFPWRNFLRSFFIRLMETKHLRKKVQNPILLATNQSRAFTQQVQAFKGSLNRQNKS